MKEAEPIVYVQIGTNSGGDEFNYLVRKNNPSKVILVEPNSVHNDSIRTHYRGIEVIIENVAIVSLKVNNPLSWCIQIIAAMEGL